MHRFRDRRAVLLTCRVALGILACGWLAGGPLGAQTFPTKPIKIILGTPPGSTIERRRAASRSGNTASCMRPARGWRCRAWV